MESCLVDSLQVRDDGTEVPLEISSPLTGALDQRSQDSHRPIRHFFIFPLESTHSRAKRYLRIAAASDEPSVRTTGPQADYARRRVPGDLAGKQNVHLQQSRWFDGIAGFEQDSAAADVQRISLAPFRLTARAVAHGCPNRVALRPRLVRSLRFLRFVSTRRVYQSRLRHRLL